MKKILLFFLILSYSYTIFSQNQLSGIITDRETEEPLAFVNVYLPDLKKGTVSKENGSFLLKDIPDGKINIQFSYIGYKTQIMTLVPSAGDTPLNIRMESTGLDCHPPFEAWYIIRVSLDISIPSEYFIEFSLGNEPSSV